MALNYRADIDGLRAIAVLSVIFFHVGIELFPGGYVGVDIFFVISGYLITSIIVREIAENRFSLRKFYERRFRRILPALTAVVIFTVALGALLLDPKNLSDLGKSAVATSLFSSNVLFFMQSGYFDGPAEMKPLLHTWSLAVEEQYYIFFPLLLMLIAKYAQNGYTRPLVVIALLSLVACIVGTPLSPSGTFYLIPTRAWELLVGSLLALQLLPGPGMRIARELIALVGLVMVTCSITFFTRETAFPGVAALLPVVGAALIIYVGVADGSLVTRWLSSPALVYVGLISYSLYLWHWPIVVYTKYYAVEPLTGGQVGGVLAATFLLAGFSWRYIETPFRQKTMLAAKHAVLGASGMALALVCAIGAALYISGGMPTRYHGLFGDQYAMADAEWESWAQCTGVERRLANGDGLCKIGAPESEPSFILWGDSHAVALASGVHMSATAAGIGGNLATFSACPPLVSIERTGRTSCNRFNETVLAYITNNPAVETVILAARWTLSMEGTRYKHEDGGAVTLVDLQRPGTHLPNSVLVETGLKRTIERLKKLHKRVVLVQPVPEVGYDVPSLRFISTLTGRDVNALISPSLDEYMRRSGNVREFLSELAEERFVELVDPAKFLCRGGICIVASDGKDLYRDDDHLSTYGSKHLSAAFDPVLGQPRMRQAAIGESGTADVTVPALRPGDGSAHADFAGFVD